MRTIIENKINVASKQTNKQEQKIPEQQMLFIKKLPKSQKINYDGDAWWATRHSPRWAWRPRWLLGAWGCERGHGLLRGFLGLEDDSSHGLLRHDDLFDGTNTGKHLYVYNTNPSNHGVSTPKREKKSKFFFFSSFADRDKIKCTRLPQICLVNVWVQVCD